MVSNVWTHWKTTLAGAALAGWHVIQTGANWKALTLAALTAALGAFSKDPK